MYREIHQIAGKDVLVKSHRGVHIDEISSLRWVRLHADEAWVKKNCPGQILELGINGGRFDEHQVNAGVPNTPENLSNGNLKCCATLMAQSLGIHERPEIQEVLAYVLSHDQGGLSHRFDLGSTIKALHAAECKIEQVIEWTSQALDAWEAAHGQVLPLDSTEQFHLECLVKARKIRFRITAGLLPQGLVAIWMIKSYAGARWLDENTVGGAISLTGRGTFGVIPDDRPFVLVQRVSESLKRHRSRELSPFLTYMKKWKMETGRRCGDVASTVQTMFYATRDLGVVMDWLETALDAKSVENQIFIAAKDELREAAIQVITLGETRVGMVAAFSDNTELQRAVRAEFKSDLYVQQNSRGNVQIFTRRGAGLCLGQVYQDLVKAEKKAGGSPLVWYYFVNGEMVFNGALTNPNVIPTKLTMAQVCEIVAGSLELKEVVLV